MKSSFILLSTACAALLAVQAVSVLSGPHDVLVEAGLFGSRSIPMAWFQ